MGLEVSDDEENYEIGGGDENPEGELDEDNQPIYCKICENIFKEPIITICGHYFCEKCALSHYS